MDNILLILALLMVAITLYNVLMLVNLRNKQNALIAAEERLQQVLLRLRLRNKPRR